MNVYREEEHFAILYLLSILGDSKLENNPSVIRFVESSSFSISPQNPGRKMIRDPHIYALCNNIKFTDNIIQCLVKLFVKIEELSDFNYDKIKPRYDICGILIHLLRLPSYQKELNNTLVESVYEGKEEGISSTPSKNEFLKNSCALVNNKLRHRVLIKKSSDGSFNLFSCYLKSETFCPYELNKWFLLWLVL